MERRQAILGGIMIVMVLAAGCAPSAPKTAEPVEPPTAQTVPSATDQTAVNTDTPAPVATTGPALQVGSTFYYVDGTTLVAVPAGEFSMGADGEDNPEHPIYLDDFWIYSTKVTNQQYALCVQFGQCTPPSLEANPFFSDIERANNPVVGVTHDQAAAYCAFVHGRLPSEAEWEKAARGPEGNLYPWGSADPSCDLLNYYSCLGKPTSVVSYPQGASYYGALDMAGNVFEWVQDWYDPAYYQNSPRENPPGPLTGRLKSVRSSGYNTNPVEIGLAIRNSAAPGSYAVDRGFRCVVDDPLYFAPLCQAPSFFEQAEVAAETCPQLDIVQQMACVKKVSTTNIIFNGPDDAVRVTGGCAPTGDPRVFSCIGQDQVSITAACQVDFSGDPACPAGYSLNGLNCLPETAQGNCLPGMEFDPASGCCTVGSQAESQVAATICPVGTYYVAGQNTCTPNPLLGVVSVVESLEFMSCGGGDQAGAGQGGSSGGGIVTVVPGNTPKPVCTPEPGCSDWNEQNCCCRSNGACY